MIMKHILHRVTVYLTGDRIAELGAWAMSAGVLYVFIRGIISMV